MYSKQLRFLIKIVKKASKIITEKFEIENKNATDSGDLVTTYDYKVEEFLIKQIKNKYPNFDIISEEYNTNNKLTNNCFTIDPIDGTINFANNLPLWGIQVACIKDGNTIAAAIYFPKLREMYCADVNGAYLNGKQIKVSKLPPNKVLFSATGKKHVECILATKMSHLHQRSFYCASLDFSYVASGKLGGAIFTNNTLWDYVPGMFICEKAGAFIHNENNLHIAANSKQLLEALKNSASNL